MASSLPPGDIATQPSNKIVFNSPFDDKRTYHIKASPYPIHSSITIIVATPILTHLSRLQIFNSGGHRIGWAIKTTNARRLGVDPPCGVLDPKVRP